MTHWYQKLTSSTAIYPPERSVEYLALGLVSESGEVAGKVKKWIRDSNLSVEELHKELGDVLWYISELLNTTGGNVDLVMEQNIEKLLDRKSMGVLGGSGDNR